MKTFAVLLLCFALVVAVFATEDDMDEDTEFIKRAMDDLNQFVKRGRRKNAFFNCEDEWGNSGCICKLIKGKKSTVNCL